MSSKPKQNQKYFISYIFFGFFSGLRLFSADLKQRDAVDFQFEYADSGLMFIEKHTVFETVGHNLWFLLHTCCSFSSFCVVWFHKRVACMCLLLNIFSPKDFSKNGIGFNFVN